MHNYDVKMPNLAWTQDNDFLCLFLNFDTASNSTQICQHLTKFEALRVHFLKDVFVAVAVVVAG